MLAVLSDQLKEIMVITSTQQRTLDPFTNLTELITQKKISMTG